MPDRNDQPQQSVLSRNTACEAVLSRENLHLQHLLRQAQAIIDMQLILSKSPHPKGHDSA